MSTSITGSRVLGLGCGQPARQRGDPAEGGAAGGRGGGRGCRACPARRAPPAQRRRGGRRARRRVVAVGAAGRVRRAYREHPDHQPDGGRPVQAVRRPAARAERRRRHHRGADGAAPAGTRAGRPVPRRRTGPEATGGRLPRGGRLADLAVEDAGAADDARDHVLDAHRRRRPGPVRGGRHATLSGTRPAAIDRAAVLGRNVASQLGVAFDEARYLGPPGLCPMCHLDVVTLRGADVECATCGARGQLGPDLTRDLDRPDHLGHLYGREARPRRGDPGHRRAPRRAARRDRGARPPCDAYDPSSAPPPPRDASRPGPGSLRAGPPGRGALLTVLPEAARDHGGCAPAGAHVLGHAGAAPVQRCRPGPRVARRLAGQDHGRRGPGGHEHVELQRAAELPETSMGPNGLMCRVVAEVIPPPGRGRTSKVRYPGPLGRSPAT